MSRYPEGRGDLYAKCRHCDREHGQHLTAGSVPYYACPLPLTTSFEPRRGDEWCGWCDDWAVNCLCDEERREAPGGRPVEPAGWRAMTPSLPPGRGCGGYTDSRPLRRQRRPDPAEFVRGALRGHPNLPGWEVGRLFRGVKS